MSEIYGKNLAIETVMMLAEDLDGYTPDAVLAALSRCRRELKSFPTIAEIIERIDDGHPGVEVAWSIAHKADDEGSTLVWTDEIAQAYYTCRDLMQHDPVAARMAFKEDYLRRVRESRQSKKQIHWNVSLGHDKLGREVALKEAVEKNRISIEQFKEIVPEIEYSPEIKEVFAQVSTLLSIEQKP